MMKTHFRIFLISAVLFAAFGCSRRNYDDRRVLAVSLEPQRYILEQIAGDRFRIVTVMPGGDNPETFEPSPAKRIDIEDAEAYFSTGLLPFEKNLLKTASDKQKFVDTSKGIKLIYGTHTHGSGASAHTHSVPDPHIWTSLRNAAVMAKNMTEKLVQIDPKNARAYQSNLERYSAHLDSLDNVLETELASAPSRSFLVWHPSLSYFANDYGLRQIAVSSETKEMSVNLLSDIVDRALSDSVGVMIYQREYDNRQAKMIGESIAARLVPFSPSAYLWENELISIVDELTER